MRKSELPFLPWLLLEKQGGAGYPGTTFEGFDLKPKKKIIPSKCHPPISQWQSLSRLGDKAEIPGASSRGTEEVFRGYRGRFPPTLQGVKQSLFCLAGCWFPPSSS